MKLNLEKSAANIVYRYDPGCVQIYSPQTEICTETGEQKPLKLTRSFILTADTIIQDWAINAQLLVIEDLQPVFELKPDVLLLGTGQSGIFPGQDLISACYAAQIGIEVMNTAAACRTYNVLASEQRNAALAITAL